VGVMMATNNEIPWTGAGPDIQSQRERAMMQALGLDPELIERLPLNFEPIGGGFIVRWQGITFVTAQQMQDAMKAYADE
jgi:hypothetical protein